MVAEREDLEFESGGDRCAAWLYRPDGDRPHPCVVLAHGMGATRLARLWAYAERFRDAGFASLVFDYRHLGDSTGQPRQLVSIKRQHQDWRAAIGFARSLEGVDPERIALWGSSFSGGHVVKVGAEDGRIAAVVAQTPFTDGLSARRAAGPRNIARLTLAGLRDGIRAIAELEPHRVPTVARPGEPALMNQPGSYEGYLRMYEDPDQFRNQVCARIALAVDTYMPARAARRLRCPLLVLTMAGDAVTPPAPARGMATRARNARHVEYPGGHFDIYVGEIFERAVSEETAFLTEHLGVGERAPASRSASAR